MSGIRIVTKSDCPFCTMAKAWFKEHAFEYEEDLIDNEEERLAFYQTINGATEVVGEKPFRRVNSVPQIFIDGTWIGGFDDVLRYDRAGELDWRLGLEDQPKVNLFTKFIRLMRGHTF